jgi:ferredoxin/flavodoxin
MRICILYFSPSGNTAGISDVIRRYLEEKNHHVQMIDITGEKLFFEGDKSEFLRGVVRPHDILMIGGPVYAHHLQYHAADLIKALPKPDDVWGKFAVPFVSYGGISSGIALEEAGKLLRRSGRAVVSAMKISSSHRMTRAFLDHEYNIGNPEENLTGILSGFEENLQTVIKGIPHDITKVLSYQKRMKALVFNIVFNEKKWHEKRYPKVFIDNALCTGCGACVRKCPVLHLQSKKSEIIESEKNKCIHCFNCVIGCPVKAIRLRGDIERGKAFMLRNIEKNGNKEIPGTYFYCRANE